MATAPKPSVPEAQPSAAEWSERSGGHKFGKRPFVIHEENKDWNFLQADDGAAPWLVDRAGAGKGVKFHSGFRRRQASAIGHDSARKQHEASKEERAARVAHHRRERLGKLDRKSGFNVITGQPNGGKAVLDPPRGKKYLSGALTDVQKREGDVLLRVSDSRFHRPVERRADDPRTRKIATEGLVTSKRGSSVLGIGRADIRSYGVRDNFEYSCYDPQYRTLSPRDEPRPPLGASRSRGGLPPLSLPSSSPDHPPSTAASRLSSTSSIRSKPPRDKHIGHDASGKMKPSASSPSLSRASSRASTLSRTSQIRYQKAEAAKLREIQAVREMSER